GLGEAKLFVIAIDGKEQITELVRYTVKNYPNVHIVARAVDRGHVFDLWAAGCRDIIRETYDSSLRMGRSAFEALGQPRDKAERIVKAFDAVDRRSMIESAEHYDPNLPFSENEAYIAMVRERIGAWEAEVNQEIQAIMDEDVDPAASETTST
ncbi:MAG: potassium transporter, partial [Pseudomonadota bacterium]